MQPLSTKNWIVIVASAVIMAALVVRLFVKKISKHRAEDRQYVESLHYAFSARVDSVRVLNQPGPGYVYAHFVAGQFNPRTEDSLNRHRRGDLFRFLETRRDSTFRFFTGYANQLRPGDSVSINSPADKIEFFRDSTLMFEREISNSIRRRERP